MKNRYAIDFCFVKYEFDNNVDVPKNLENMGYTLLSTHTAEDKMWLGCNRSLFLGESKQNGLNRIKGLGFISEEPDMVEKVTDLNGFELTILGERKLEDVIANNYTQPIVINLQKSSIINTYGIIYDCINFPKTVDYYKTNWRFEEIRSTDTTAILRSPNKRTFIKFYKSDINCISTVYLGVENIRDLITTYVYRDLNFVDPGKNFNFNFELDNNLNESTINNYKIALAGSRKNFVLEVGMKQAIPGVNFVFSERKSFNDISDSNYEKFRTQFS